MIASNSNFKGDKSDNARDFIKVLKESYIMICIWNQYKKLQMKKKKML